MSIKPGVSHLPALAICFAIQLVVGGIYSFTTPNIFAAVVAACLIAAAWLAPTGAGAQS